MLFVGDDWAEEHDDVEIVDHRLGTPPHHRSRLTPTTMGCLRARPPLGVPTAGGRSRRRRRPRSVGRRGCRAVAFPVPTTAGMPYSRATTAQWLRMPPVSDTTAAAVANSGVHGGAVVSTTSTSRGCSLPRVRQRVKHARRTGGLAGGTAAATDGGVVGRGRRWPDDGRWPEELGERDGDRVGGCRRGRRGAQGGRHRQVAEVLHLGAPGRDLACAGPAGAIRAPFRVARRSVRRNTSSGRSTTPAAENRRPTSSEIRCTWYMQRKSIQCEWSSVSTIAFWAAWSRNSKRSRTSGGWLRIRSRARATSRSRSAACAASSPSRSRSG